MEQLTGCGTNLWAEETCSKYSSEPTHQDKTKPTTTECIFCSRQINEEIFEAHNPKMTIRKLPILLSRGEYENPR